MLWESLAANLLLLRWFVLPARRPRWTWAPRSSVGSVGDAGRAHSHTPTIVARGEVARASRPSRGLNLSRTPTRSQMLALAVVLSLKLRCGFFSQAPLRVLPTRSGAGSLTRSPFGSGSCSLPLRLGCRLRPRLGSPGSASHSGSALVRANPTAAAPRPRRYRSHRCRRPRAFVRASSPAARRYRSHRCWRARARSRLRFRPGSCDRLRSGPVSGLGPADVSAWVASAFALPACRRCAWRLPSFIRAGLRGRCPPIVRCHPIVRARRSCGARRSCVGAPPLVRRARAERPYPPIPPRGSLRQRAKESVEVC